MKLIRLHKPNKEWLFSSVSSDATVSFTAIVWRVVRKISRANPGISPTDGSTGKSWVRVCLLSSWSKTSNKFGTVVFTSELYTCHISARLLA